MDRGRRRAADRLADRHGGVVSRRMLALVGIDRDAVARQVAADRWAECGRHTVAVHRGPLPTEAAHWRAVWEIGERVALLDGVSSLHAAGLTGFDEPVVHVSVTRNARCEVSEGVRTHRVRRVVDECRDAGSIPRTTPAVAALRAGAWAVSDRQAALLLAMTVQQRLVTGPQLLAAARVVRSRGRRPFLRHVVQDIADGAQSLGELDVALLCRRYGLPEPSRQVVRRGSRGRVYLDVSWEHVRLVVEIDGSGHRMGLAVTADNFRQNDLTLGGERVLRFDLLALRLQEVEVMRQVRLGLGECV